MQSDWCDNMLMCFIIRLQFYLRKCPDPIFLHTYVHENIGVGTRQMVK